MTILFISSPSTLNTPSRHFFTVHTVSRDRYRESNRVTPFLFSLFFFSFFLSFPSRVSTPGSPECGIAMLPWPTARNQEEAPTFCLPPIFCIVPRMIIERSVRFTHARFPFPLFSFSFLFLMRVYTHATEISSKGSNSLVRLETSRGYTSSQVSSAKKKKDISCRLCKSNVVADGKLVIIGGVVETSGAER